MIYTVQILYSFDEVKDAGLVLNRGHLDSELEFLQFLASVKFSANLLLCVNLRLDALHALLLHAKR